MPINSFALSVYNVPNNFPSSLKKLWFLRKLELFDHKVVSLMSMIAKWKGALMSFKLNFLGSGNVSNEVKQLIFLVKGSLFSSLYN